MLRCRNQTLTEPSVAKVRIFTCILALILGACSEPPAADPTKTVENRVDRIASEFVDGYYSHYPEDVYETGYPDAPMDRFGDHSEGFGHGLGHAGRSLAGRA